MKQSDLLALAEMRGACKSGAARAAREAAELTQHEVAAACGVSAQAVSQWETGQRKARGGPALEYARLLQRLARSGA